MARTVTDPFEFQHAAEVGFDELAGEVETYGIDGLDTGLRHGGPMNAGERRQQREDDDDDDRDRRPALLGPLRDFGAAVTVMNRHCSVPRGRKMNR